MTGDGIEMVRLRTSFNILQIRLSYYNPSGWFNTQYLCDSRAPLCVARCGCRPLSIANCIFVLFVILLNLKSKCNFDLSVRDQSYLFAAAIALLLLRCIRRFMHPGSLGIN